MGNLTPQELTIIFLALAVLLGTARLLGELARYCGQPSVLGEIAAGILLGPTILGRIAPELQGALFPFEPLDDGTKNSVAIVLEAMFALAVVFFLLVAGLEVDLSVAFRQGSTTFKVAFLGMLVPGAMGFATAWFFPEILSDIDDDKRFVFALFFATALSISALPVVVKILKDLGLVKSDMGVIVVAAAIVNDLIGWIVFAIILGMIGVGKGALPVYMVIILTLVFVAFMLTIGRWIMHKSLVHLQAYLSWPAGVLSISLAMALLCAAFTEWLGIHAIFGAFLFGVVLGDSRYLRQETRATLDHFISYTFAPLFFASIGLAVDFIGNFSLVPVVVVFVLACVGKIAGCYIGGLISGLSKRESLAIGAAKNARGAMEIILGLLALQYGLIDEIFFVALVIMALLTSMVSGTLVQMVLSLKKSVTLKEFLSAGRIDWNLEGNSREDVVRSLTDLLAKKAAIENPDSVFDAVMERERIMSTGLENQVAIPHARIVGIKKPIVAVGRHVDGIDFDGSDGKPARLIFMILTPADQPNDQLEILQSIGKTIRRGPFVEKLIDSENATEFLAALKLKDEQEAEGH